MEDRYLFKANRLDNGEWLEWDVIAGIPENVSILADTICQCTGLKDKNGKLIWENDIVKKEFYIDYDSVYQEEYVTSVISKKYVGTVKFEHFAWVVETFNDKLKCILPICELSEHSEDIKHFEVIGNIFDNPGLLRRNDE
ncbi:MAG: YopX family protein [Lachnospiraceae bacterium]|nr:YopX family protein [Lachnospiraceae bacterium]